MGHQGDDGSVVDRPHLPDVEISDSVVGIRFNFLLNQLNVVFCNIPVKKNGTGIFQQTIGPAGYDQSSDNAHQRIKPLPAKNLAKREGEYCKDSYQDIRQHMEVGTPEIMVMMLAVPFFMRVGMMAMQQVRAKKVYDKPENYNAYYLFE